jgi:basic membrane lipoprotein Med (substrate-binding protein (PBP1-ABC) superfamily)
VWCEAKCDRSTRCTGNLVCAGDSVCRSPLRVAVWYDGDPALLGFSQAHADGRRAAALELPGVEFIRPEQDPFTKLNVNTGDTPLVRIDKAAQAAAAENADLVLMTSSVLRPSVQTLAMQYPKIKFVQFDSPTGLTANYGSYFGNYHQAWYIAGATASKFYYTNQKLSGAFPSNTKTACIGVLAPVPSPQQVVAQINAFARGVASETDGAGRKLEIRVRWSGSFAPAKESYEADVTELIGLGCNVIINRLGTNAASEFVATESATDPAKPIYTMVRDNIDGCSKGSDNLKKACIGAPYWNFAPAYKRLILAVQAGAYDPLKPINENMRASLSASMFNFQVNKENLPGLLDFVDEGTFLTPKRAEAVSTDGKQDLTFATATKADARWWDGAMPGTLPDVFNDDKNLRDPYQMCWMHSLIVDQKASNNPAASNLGPISTACKKLQIATVQR